MFVVFVNPVGKLLLEFFDDHLCGKGLFLIKDGSCTVPILNLIRNPDLPHIQGLFQQFMAVESFCAECFGVSGILIKRPGNDDPFIEGRYILDLPARTLQDFTGKFLNDVLRYPGCAQSEVNILNPNGFGLNRSEGLNMFFISLVRFNCLLSNPQLFTDIAAQIPLRRFPESVSWIIKGNPFIQKLGLYLLCGLADQLGQIRCIDLAPVTQGYSKGIG